MNTLILYATKHGATREIAERIAARIPGATVCDLAGGSVPSLDAYDCVLVGSPLYVGMARKAAKTFVANNEQALMGKRLGLFLSGMSDTGLDGYLSGNYPAQVVQHACAKALLGGVFDPKKANLFERLAMRAVAKHTSYSSTLSDDAIAKFVDALKA